MKSSKNSRIEKDSLGSLAIPQDAPWGIRTQRFIEKQGNFFQVPLNQFPSYIKNLLLLKKVILLSNMESKDIDPKFGSVLIESCDLLLKTPETWTEFFLVDTTWGGGQIAVHSNLNDMILHHSRKNLDSNILKDKNSWEKLLNSLKASHSTADLCHSAARITLKEKWEDILTEIENIKESTKSLCLKFSKHKLMAKTCLQDAFEVRASLLWESFFEKISQLQEKINVLQKTSLTICLGGTVLGTGDGASEKYRKALPKHLTKNFSLPITISKTPEDLLSNGSDLSEAANFLWQISTTIKKMAKDIRLLSSGPVTGYKEIQREFYFEGSAFFKNKNNPIIEESILQLHLILSSKVSLVNHAIEEQELYLNVYDSLSFFALYDIFDILKREIYLLNHYSLQNLELNKSKV